MKDIVIKNVKTVEYEDSNLNEYYKPNHSTKHKFEFQRGNVVSPFKDGEGRINVNFYTLEPGKRNYPYHQHFGREEVFYIISGSATLKTPRGNREVTEGDVIVIPANSNGAHMLTNTSKEMFSYLDVDTISSSDVVVYPDSGNVRVLTGDMQKTFKLETEVNYLDGE